MSAPTSITDSSDLFDSNQLSKSKQSFRSYLLLLLPNPFVDLMIFFVQYAVDPSSRCKFLFFLPYLSLCISMNIKAPVI